MVGSARKAFRASEPTLVAVGVGMEANLPLRYTPRRCKKRHACRVNARTQASLRPIAPGNALRPLPPWDVCFLGAFFMRPARVRIRA